MPVQELRTLRVLADICGIAIGSAVKVPPLQNEVRYRDTIRQQFNSITPELAMKFDAIHPQRYDYDFQAADVLVDFAESNEMLVRGHTLVWHKALPEWITQGNFSTLELSTILREHIETLLKRYRGRVQIWDVVNEAVGDDGRLRDTIWSQALGADYIEQVFYLAHEADPEARLFYNDYGGEGRGYKSDRIYALLERLRKQGVPVHGVGLQMHVSLKRSFKMQEIVSNLERLTALGLEVQITEMDVAWLDDPRKTAVKLEEQARIYRDMLRACLSVPNVTAFVMWGFTDRYYWIDQAPGADAPLIFDELYRPKPAYTALRDALLERLR